VSEREVRMRERRSAKRESRSEEKEWKKALRSVRKD
jgi:hypothetical protein